MIHKVALSLLKIALVIFVNNITNIIIQSLDKSRENQNVCSRTRRLLQQLETVPNVNFIGNNHEPETEVKDLGIFLGSHLTFNKHKQKLSSLCVSKLNQISWVEHMFDRTTLTNIIETLVLSKVNYCSSVWSNTTDSCNIKKLHLSKTMLLDSLQESQKIWSYIPGYKVTWLVAN